MNTLFFRHMPGIERAFNASTREHACACIDGVTPLGANGSGQDAL
ncbi:MAG: hypothetical protein JWM03_144 [Rhodocyclales bacterium]|nr:hypothetical protein [Rhodocyclales bacterium]MDB5887272.1 hypothetical protein [Rhodocyclales bacterium]